MINTRHSYYLTAVSHPIKHTLPHESLVSVFGSEVNGRCTSISEGVCDGTSVLNDGIVQGLNSVSNTSNSQWADQLLTMNRTSSGVANVSLTFQVSSETVDHDRLELVVFNCPQLGIHTPVVEIYVKTSFVSPGFRFFHTRMSLRTTSCDHLLKFCLKFEGTLSTKYYTLHFPYQSNSNYIFLGEVTFLSADRDVPCDIGAPEIIINPTTSTPLTGMY